MALSILGLSAWGVMDSRGIAGLANAGPHGLSEILYAYTSAAANNGSAFAGLTANTPFWNITLAVAIFFGQIARLANERLHASFEGHAAVAADLGLARVLDGGLDNWHVC
jgi:K+-transporting ATPase A subunit